MPKSSSVGPSVCIVVDSVSVSSVDHLLHTPYFDHPRNHVSLQYVYEDSMDLIAKLPTIAAIIYRNLYRDGTSVGAIDPDKDWSYNFTSMLGYEDPHFAELMRLYLTIHRYGAGRNTTSLSTAVALTTAQSNLLRKDKYLFVVLTSESSNNALCIFCVCQRPRGRKCERPHVSLGRLCTQ